jgi:hypothetical protein
MHSLWGICELTALMTDFPATIAKLDAANKSNAIQGPFVSIGLS